MKINSRSRIASSILFLLGTCLFYAAIADGESALLLLSDDDKITELVSASFLENFEGEVQDLSLKGASREEIQAAKDQDLGIVVAVGDDAIKPSLEISAEVPVIFCAVDDFMLAKISRQNAYVIINETSPDDQIKSFKEFMPDLKSLGVIFSPGRSGSYIKEARCAADQIGIELIAKSVLSIKDFPASVREVIPKVDAMWALSDPELTSREAFNYMLLIAFENNTPVLASSSRLVKSGAVFAYAPDYRGVGQRVADIARSIMSGEAPSPGALKIDTGQAVINQRTSSLLRITIREELKNRALMY
jgi:putative ABC transport system substrate-binding protein